ncbi:MAG: DUF4126 domain-containing protein [Usitatibacter sp.]
MSPDLTLLQSVALASLLAWASGLRLYLVVFAVGLAGHLGYVELPKGLEVLQHPWVIGAAGFMLVMEFIADKVPAIDSFWDAVHTFIRIPAGALLAAGVAGDDLSAYTVAAGLIGGTITAGTHFSKAGGRALINTSPEPFSNWGASFTEDAMVITGIWLAFAHPLVFLLLLLLFFLMLIWLIPKVWRGLRLVFSRLRQGTPIDADATPTAADRAGRVP